MKIKFTTLYFIIKNENYKLYIKKCKIIIINNLINNLIILCDDFRVNEFEKFEILFTVNSFLQLLSNCNTISVNSILQFNLIRYLYYKNENSKKY